MRHRYEVRLRWTGDRGSGTSSYTGYDRAHVVTAPGRPDLPGSSDPAFRGAGDRWNPEQLLVASLAQCHLLWFLHLASDAGVVVTAYDDAATGTLAMDPDDVPGVGRGGEFAEVVLRPRVTVTDAAMVQPAQELHDRVGAVCFVARSVRFPVRHEPTTTVAALRG